MDFRKVCTALIVGSAGLALSACATPAYTGPVQVTRFVGEAPAMLGSGSITLVAAPGIDGESLEFGLYETAVARELAGLGYQVVESDGEQIARIDVTQSVASEARRSPVSVGGGASTGSFGSGVGLGIGLNLSGAPRDRIETLLSVSIRPGDGETALWEGRAAFVATDNSEAADPAVAAQKLASGLFADFPGNSGETVEIP